MVPWIPGPVDYEAAQQQFAILMTYCIAIAMWAGCYVYLFKTQGIKGANE